MFLLIRFSIWHPFKFKIDFPSTKYKICHVSVTTPLNIALWENQFATLCDVAAKASSRRFLVLSGITIYKILFFMFLLIRFSIWHSFKFKIDFPSTKYKICHVSVTTPLDIALWENQLATSRGVAARSSLKKFKFKMDFPCAKYKFVIFLLPHQQIWHSEKISLQHRVVWQQDHLLEDVRFQIDLHLQKKKFCFS